jgi:hypothetical protein
MSATEIMVIAIMLGVVGRWANDQTAVPSARSVVEIVFALLLISMLDQGKTEPIAKGFAWLFFAAVLLSDNSPLTGLSKTFGNGPAKAGAGVGGGLVGITTGKGVSGGAATVTS